MIPLVQLVDYELNSAPVIFDEVVSYISGKGLKVGVTRSVEIEKIHNGPMSMTLSEEAETEVLLGANSIITIEKRNPSEKFREVYPRYFRNADIVLYAGSIDDEVPEIAFIHDDIPSSERMARKKIFALVGHSTVMETNLPVIEPDNPKAVGDFIIDTFHLEQKKRRKDESNALLLVDGNNVGMKPFVEDLVVSVMRGIVNNLKNTAGGKDVEFRFRL